MIYDVSFWHPWLFISRPSVVSQSKEGRNRCSKNMLEQRVRCFQRQYMLDRRVVKDLKVKNLEETSVQSRVKESQRVFPHFYSTKDHFLILKDEFYSYK